jgi:hypothetical protein
MGFNIKNNYGPNIEVNAGGKVTLVQDKSGHWTTDIEEAQIVEDEVKEQGGQEHDEKLCFFIHPSIDSSQEWQIHNEIKRLVKRHGIKEICSFLLQMRKDNKLLLPQSPSAAYEELVRMGMPSGDGFNENTFRKYYKN